MHTSTILATALATFSSLHSASASYSLVEDFFDNGAGGFFDHFDYFTGADPTHGLVNYVDSTFADTNKMTAVKPVNGGEVAWITTDSINVLAGNQGRNSIRLSSKNSYNHMLVVIKVDKIPVSCGSWPAFWTLGSNWPAHGEIDIIEGVHNQLTNQMTMHTSAGCSAAGAGSGLAQPVSSSCQGNNGCGFMQSAPESWSRANKVGGGIWAMEWNSNGISIWWWDNENQAGNAFSASPEPESWGKPQMNLPNGGNCGIDQHFVEHKLVFDWTFCGDWAGQQNVWENSGCSSQKYPTCQSFVQNNPSAYKDVGWEISSLKIFKE